MSEVPLETEQEQVQALEAAMGRAFASGDDSHLEVLGYGEISTTVAWPPGSEGRAFKRLPPFPTVQRAEAYGDCFSRYLKRLREAGVRPVPSELRSLSREDGSVVLYCVQPRLPAGGLATRLMACQQPGRALALLDRITDTIFGCVTPRLGLDGQLSNWVLVEGELRYLDVTTPMLRTADGADELDVDLFLASAPPGLRWLLKKLLLPSILDKYHSPRGVLLDLLGNLIKERLELLLPAFLEHLAGRVDPPLTAREVRSYYKWDARIWALWQALRRLDRWWKLRVRRRPYPFLLPGKIERHM